MPDHSSQQMHEEEALKWALLRCPEFRARIGLPPLGCPLTGRQIAAVLGINKSAVSQTERRALRKLRLKISKLLLHH